MSSRKTLFISDLHVDENQPEITRAFLQLLKDSQGSSVDALYILGDLFEAWIGDDDKTPLHQTIIHALKAATDDGLRIYFMYGNRDFLIGKQFLCETGCVLLPDETNINVYGTPVLLMHGDVLCTQDVAYLRARKWARQPFLQMLFLLLPLRLRLKIANNMRQKSRRHTQSVAADVMDVTQVAVEEVMQKHEVTYLIHGHTHKPGMHQFFLNHLPATRMVLGAWHDGANAILWDETGKKEFIHL